MNNTNIFLANEYLKRRSIFLIFQDHVLSLCIWDSKIININPLAIFCDVLIDKIERKTTLHSILPIQTINAKMICFLKFSCDCNASFYEHSTIIQTNKLTKSRTSRDNAPINKQKQRLGYPKKLISIAKGYLLI